MGLNDIMARADRWNQLLAYTTPGSPGANSTFNARATRQFGNLGEKVTRAGGTAPAQLQWSSMDPTAQDAAETLFAGMGPKKAMQTSVAQTNAAEREEASRREQALGSLSDFSTQITTDPRRAAIWNYLRSQLENPASLDKEFQLAEGKIRAGAAQASRNWEQRARTSLGSRGLPGDPFLSGPGIGALGQFESNLGRGTEEALRQNQIAQIMAQREIQARAAAASQSMLGQEEGLLGNVAGMRANIEARNPLVLAPQAYQDYAQFLLAMKEADAAKGTNWGAVGSGALSGATTGFMVGGPIGAGVGALAGGGMAYAGGSGGGAQGVNPMLQYLMSQQNAGGSVAPTSPYSYPGTTPVAPAQNPYLYDYLNYGAGTTPSAY